MPIREPHRKEACSRLVIIIICHCPRKLYTVSTESTAREGVGWQHFRKSDSASFFSTVHLYWLCSHLNEVVLAYYQYLAELKIFAVFWKVINGDSLRCAVLLHFYWIGFGRTSILKCNLPVVKCSNYSPLKFSLLSWKAECPINSVFIFARKRKSCKFNLKLYSYSYSYSRST